MSTLPSQLLLVAEELNLTELQVLFSTTQRILNTDTTCNA